MPEEGLYVVDTTEVYAGLEGSSTGNTKSLDRVCKQMQINTKDLHNAGNDAYVRLCDRQGQFVIDGRLSVYS